MNTVRLIAIDLDGTLVSNRSIAEADKKTVKEILERGIPLVPTTTRLRRSTSDLLTCFSLDDYPLICNNGARILGPGWNSDWRDAELRAVKLGKDIAKKIANYSDERDYKLSTVFSEKVFRKRDQKYEKRYPHPKVSYASSNISALDNGTPLSFMMHKSENDLEALKDVEGFVSSEFKEKVRLDRHHRGEEYLSLTIYDRSVSKLKGLELACETMNISLDEVLAIGDDEVDKEMIEGAGIGIAMGDSPLGVRKIADDVAPTCEDNGVSWALNKYVL